MALPYIRFGIDVCTCATQVQVPCYNSSAKIRAFMETKGWSTECPPQLAIANAANSSRTDARGDVANEAQTTAHCVGFKHLIAFFLRQVQALAKKHKRKPAGWQEIFDHYVRASVAMLLQH